MPKVGNKEFAYTPEGEAAAEDYAIETGQNVIPSYDAGGRVERIQGYGKGGEVTKNQRNLRDLMAASGMLGDIEGSQKQRRKKKIEKETSRVTKPGHVKDETKKSRKKLDKMDLTKSGYKARQEFKELGKTKSQKRGVKTYKPQKKS